MIRVFVLYGLLLMRITEANSGSNLGYKSDTVHIGDVIVMGPSPATTVNLISLRNVANPTPSASNVESGLNLNTNTTPTSSNAQFPINMRNIFFPSRPDEEQAAKSSPVKTIIPRLKQLKYGEILTSGDVLARLQEAEKKKLEKIKTKLEKKKPRMKLQQTEISSSDEEDDPILPSSNDVSFGAVEVDEIELEPINHLRDLQPGLFVLVAFKGGKRNAMLFKYLCRVELVEAAEDEVKIVGFKSSDSSNTCFHIVENDVSYVKLSQIVGVLPEPSENIDNTGLISFTKRVPVKEIGTT